ncbi:MAG: transposase, partial [Gemmataceae bacterium]
MKTPSGRHRYNVLGALDYQTKELVRVCNTGYVNAQTVWELLHKLRQMYPEQKIKIFLDNARYQRCRLVQDLAEELGIELEFLPSYSP